LNVPVGSADAGEAEAAAVQPTAIVANRTHARRMRNVNDGSGIETSIQMWMHNERSHSSVWSVS
jgi:hypothetical protein